MKKANNIISKIFLLVNVVCLFTFNFIFISCGLDVLYVINSPESVGGTLDEYTDFPERHFDFRTNESSDIEGLIVLGTDVYYRIYDNLDRLKSDVSYINDTDNNSSTKDKLLSGSRAFKPLKIQNYNGSVLIPANEDQKKHNVTIRLTDYQNSPEYSARVLVDGVNIYNSSSRAIPIRNISEAKTFNFGRTGSKDGKPLSSDDDTYISSSNSTVFYVAMYAVTIGHDAAYASYFSEPLYLGYMKIDSNVKDN